MTGSQFSLLEALNSDLRWLDGTSWKPIGEVSRCHPSFANDRPCPNMVWDPSTS